MNNGIGARRLFRLLLATLILWGLNLVSLPGWAATLVITQASLTSQSLIVSGTLKRGNASSVYLYDSSGRLLGQAPVDAGQRFSLSKSDIDHPELLCSIQAKTGDAAATAVVKGRLKSCAVAPVCKILAPVGTITATVDTDVSFKAKAVFKDKKAKPLRMEWDFGGGAMGEEIPNVTPPTFLRPAKTKTTVKFVRDNSRYRVRFSAWDKMQRYCEDSVEVVVGTPPDTDSGFQDALSQIKAMARTSVESVPRAVDNLRGQTGDKVVLPFEDRSMQCGTDSRILPSAEVDYPYSSNTINAYVYEKALRPVPLGTDRVDLYYAAASNPADPAGEDSINSTSQNWPADVPTASALLQKGELFERFVRPPETQLSEWYISWSLMDQMNNNYGAANDRSLQPDEGPFDASLNPPINADHGRYMPGIDAPYQVNALQPFSSFVVDKNWFSAVWLPLTDIDDSGRVNPTSLFRVQAFEAGTQTPIAATDAVVTSGRDFHCRECHASGNIGANPDIDRTGAWGDHTVMWMPPSGTSLVDQEYDAQVNINMLHAFYDDPMMIGMRFMDDMMGKPIDYDGPRPCAGGPGMCHSQPTPLALYQGKIGRERPRTDRGSLSNAMHRMHGTLQYNAGRTDVLRDDKGRYLCWNDPLRKDCAIDPAASLFPVKDAKTGKILPMEENCLKCHSGEREQCYRDRMYTAGVTCYQCHGDMLAVADIYEKPTPNPDGNTHRLEWLDQPDCGSCHTGSGNRGKDGKNGYFSAGVKTLAFAENDPSATPNKVDLSNPDEGRFGVMPLTELPQSTGDYNDTLRTPLYRMGKDRHGQVACAACHGAAHAVWPNRNPNANDNVTALELQGHTGTLLECNVCHTADSFANYQDLDDGLKVAERQDGVLGGPHNLHPVNDRNWWKTAAADTPNTDGSSSGGWHNDYAKVEGKSSEDQCAACHGNDHKGTRLSKVPVDRVFDFTDAPDLAKLRKKGIKPIVSVKAGTPIGCNICHDIQLSCTGSPNPECGKVSDHVTDSSNLPPTVTPPYAIDAIIGETLTYSLTATDPEGGAVTFAMGGAEPDIQLGPDGALWVEGSAIARWASGIGAIQQQTNQYSRPPFEHRFTVAVIDDQGHPQIQPMTIRFDCPAGLAWDALSLQCAAIAFTALPPSEGIDGGPIWNYQVAALSATGLKLTYTLADPVPPGMTIDTSGKLTWDTSRAAGEYPITVTVADTDGNTADYPLYLIVCQAPMHWNGDLGTCVGAVHITSTAPIGASTHQPFGYQVTATQDNHKPLAYRLIDAPAGMVISATGLITWDTGDHMNEQITFNLEVSDNLGSWARESGYVWICQGATPVWDPTAKNCTFGPIQITSLPEGGVSANSSFHYQLSTSNTHGIPVSYALTSAPEGMTLSADGLITWDSSGMAGQNISYRVEASDTQGAWTAQDIVTSVCPLDVPIWDATAGACVGVFSFESTPPNGIDGGGVWTYPVAAISAIGSIPAYGLVPPVPPNMSIDTATGVINWDLQDPVQVPSDIYSVTVKVTDNLGGNQDMPFNIWVCQPPMAWSEADGTCIGSVRINSAAPWGAGYSQPFTYPIEATDDSPGTSFTYSLSGLDGYPVPFGMAIDDHGLLTWDTTGITDTYTQFQIQVSNGLGSWARQNVYLSVCTMDAPNWNADQGICL